MDHYRIVEHRLRVARADRLGPHMAELDLQRRRPDQGPAVRRPRQAVGATLVAAGIWLRGEPRAEPARPDLADALGTGG